MHIFEIHRYKKLSKKESPFRHFITDLFKEKVRSNITFCCICLLCYICKIHFQIKNSGLPENHEEFLKELQHRFGIELKEEDVTYNRAMQLIAKLTMNSFYGKFGQRNDRMQTAFIDNIGDLNKLLDNKTLEISTMNLINNKIVVCSYRRTSTVDNEELSFQNAFIASIVTANARCLLYKNMAHLQERLLYVDTGKIFTVCHS
jgi:hypothetical protein